MIIMVNGAFGVGKTSVSNELLKEIKNSMIFDPEEIGFMLRNLLPSDIKQLEARAGDFQDLVLWKELTVHVAKEIKTKYKLNLIVPMTIRNPEYFNYIFDGFKSIDERTFHFCLVANEETIFNRLRKRGEEEGNWCFQQTMKCIQSFKENEFKEYINTDNLSVNRIAKKIIGRVSS